MTKEIQNAKPDTVLKNYWSDNEAFADLFNALLFEGNPVIRASDLEDMDTDESTVLEHRDCIQTIEAARDNLKVQKKSTATGVQFVLLGLENQERIHYAMPIRIMGYDYSAYKKQYDTNGKKYRSSVGLEADEYLSKMKKTDKFIPVVTAVIYYGEKPWDGAKSLHELLDISPEIKPFVNDYKMILVEARKNNLIFHDTNNIDFFHLLSILLDTDKPTAQLRQLVTEYTKDNQVDRHVIIAASSAARCKLDYHEFNEKGEDTMTLFERIEKESKLEGKIEGRAAEIIETGFEFGFSEEKILERLQKKLNVSLDTAKKYFTMFKSQTP